MSRSAPLMRLIRAYFPPRPWLALPLILLVIAADVCCPLLVMRAIDTLIAGQAHQADWLPAYRSVVLIAGAMSVFVAAQYIARYVLTRRQNRAVFDGAARLRTDLHDRLSRRRIDAVGTRTGALLSHVMTDVQILQEALLELLSETPFDLCVIVGLLVAMFWLQPWLGAVVLAFLLLAAAVAWWLARHGWRSQETTMARMDDLQASLSESIGAGQAMQQLNAVAGEGRRVSLATQALADGQDATGRVHAAITPFFGLSEYLGLLIVLLVGGWFMLHGMLTAGGLVAFLAYMEVAAEPLARAGRVLPLLQRAMVSAQRLDALLASNAAASTDVAALDHTTTAGASLPHAISGAVATHTLQFSYPGAARPALSGLSFTVPAGSRVAIIGHNAAGKSTLLDLLLQIQQPSFGSITIDGVDLRAFAPETWRAHIGVVPQETVVLNRSLAENIALGAEHASPAQIRAAAAAAGVDALAATLPDGFDTVLGERGALLSGGQRQRLAIARVMLRDPRIVLLDEPTSALDLAGEAEVVEALARLCQGRTTFIVSHRPAVLAVADLVLVLGAGRQLACAPPATVWRELPHLRSLFPSAWNVLPPFGVTDEPSHPNPYRRNEEPAASARHPA